MWPFKKKKIEEDIIPATTETVICIPGTWNSWNEFILLIVAATNGEYLAVGQVLMNAKNKKHFTIEFCEHDNRMKQSFEYAGRVTRVTDNFLNEIENHKHVIYISCPTGSLKEASHIAFAAHAILKAGGIGVKIETAGKAFEKTKWFALIETFEEHNLYEMFVVDSIVDETNAVYSCGMHNLGYKDTIISGEEFQEAVKLISLFGYFQIIDKPIIQNKHTFTPSAESPTFRITNELDQPNKGHNLFENPFGMWCLTRE